VNVLEIVWSVVSSRLLSEILVLLSLPFLNGYAMYRVMLAAANAGKPLEVAISGFGGAVWLFGYMVHGLEGHVGPSELDYSLWIVGMTLMLAPKLMGMWRDHIKAISDP
jgi:hypothetical protein